jgi:cytochrome c5
LNVLKGGEWIMVVATLLLAMMTGCSRQDDAADAGPRHPGEQIYLNTCFSCHAAGVAGAPRVGDAEAWALRAEKGRDALLASTVDGIAPGMPPKGLCQDCTDEELGQAIDYMLEASQPAAEGSR